MIISGYNNERRMTSLAMNDSESTLLNILFRRMQSCIFQCKHRDLDLKSRSLRSNKLSSRRGSR